MNDARDGHQVSVFINGKVLVTGGVSELGGNALYSAELYHLFETN